MFHDEQNTGIEHLIKNFKGIRKMETDLTSILIGLASLATFLLPIGYYQLREKKSLKEAKKLFLKKADDIGFQADDIEVFRNRAAIGFDKNHEELLYVSGNQHQLIKLTDVVDCTIYKNLKKDPESDGSVFQQTGVRIKLHKGLDANLPIFEGREGTMIGDEKMIIQRWIGKINTANKEVSVIT